MLRVARPKIFCACAHARTAHSPHVFWLCLCAQISLTEESVRLIRQMISTSTLLLSLDDAALTTERIAFAIRPCLPITFPISEGATWSSTVMFLPSSFCVTTTSSGFSTRAFAITSTNSFIVHLQKRPEALITVQCLHSYKLPYFVTPTVLKILLTISVGCAPLASHFFASSSFTL